jgi:hypothetical protein
MKWELVSAGTANAVSGEAWYPPTRTRSLELWLEEPVTCACTRRQMFDCGTYYPQLLKRLESGWDCRSGLAGTFVVPIVLAYARLSTEGAGLSLVPAA